MDNRDILIGVLASALVGALILWWQAEEPEPIARQEPSRAPARMPAREAERTAPSPTGPYDRSAVRPGPRWSQDPAPEAGMPVNPKQVESFRFRPLGERERERLQRQAPYSGSPWLPQDRSRSTPEYGAPPMEPGDPWGQGYGRAGPGPGSRDTGRDTRDRWQAPDPTWDWGGNPEGPEPPPYRTVPQGRTSPDQAPPLQRMYPRPRPVDGRTAVRQTANRGSSPRGTAARETSTAGKPQG
jgi:hypothetical protein